MFDFSAENLPLLARHPPEEFPHSRDKDKAHISTALRQAFGRRQVNRLRNGP
jgi:hypothetical protein